MVTFTSGEAYLSSQLTVADGGVARLVIGDGLLLLRGEDTAAAFQASDDPVHSGEEILFLNLLLVVAGGDEGGLVTHIGDVGAGEAGRLLGEEVKVHIGTEFEFAHVHTEDAAALVEVGQLHRNLTVEAASTQQGAVEDIGAVGGRHNDNARVSGETVHLGQQLVEGALALVVGVRDSALATGAPDGVYLIDEYDAGGLLFGSLEEVAHAGGTHAHEHLHKVGA